MLPSVDPELAALFARNLRTAIEARGTNQNQLAKALGMTRAGVNRLCQGRVLPSVEMLVALCRALRVSADRLLGLR